jgi:pimeloyl-ACP methyl ester carboxylesterase
MAIGFPYRLTGTSVSPFGMVQSEAIVAELETFSVELNGFSSRVWRKGSGPKLGFLSGFGGLPRWIPFLDALARERTVIVPSLPGFPGGERGHTVLDSHLDWVLAIRQLLQKAGLDGVDLAGSSVGGSFAAEIAAIWPNAVRRLALIAPWGLFGEKEPMTDPWAQRPPEVPALLCADAEHWNQLKTEPEGVNSPEWPIEQTRANEAAARAFWPLGNTRLEKRLPLIEAPTLLIWGEQDRMIPSSYADRFAAAIRGRSEIATIPGAGHLAELDKPDEVAAAILRWTA